MLTCTFAVGMYNKFSNALTQKNFNLTKDEREDTLKLLQQMKYSRSEEHYTAIYKIFEATIASNVVTHFNQNFHGIRNDWTLYSMLQFFGNTTNNRNEGLHARIKHF